MRIKQSIYGSLWTVAALVASALELGCTATSSIGDDGGTTDSHTAFGDGAASSDAAALPEPKCGLRSPLFTRRDFTSGYALNSVHAADIDRDGNLDLMMINDAGSELTMLFGDGTGGGADTLVTEFLYPSYTGPRAYSASVRVTSADLNQDGWPDVIDALTGPYSLNVLPGAGTRKFGTVQALPLDHDPSAIAVGNFDSDRFPDLLVATEQVPSLSLFFGSAAGLRPAVAIPVQGPVSDVVVGDFDKDGITDIAVALLNQAAVQILFGAGLGAFPRQAIYAVGQQPKALVAVDLDRDGRVDLATANFGDDTVSILMARDFGIFSAPTTWSTPTGPIGLASGDLSCDGFPELVVTNLIASTIHILANDGTGHLSPLSPMAVGKYPSAVTLADFDNDRNMDIIVASKGRAVASVYLNRSR